MGQNLIEKKESEYKTMAKLYPPIIENVLPAFCLERVNGKPAGASIKINFELNRAVAEADVKGVVLRLRTISTNKYIVTEETRCPPSRAP